jgi:hypothetical protein
MHAISHSFAHSDSFRSCAPTLPQGYQTRIFRCGVVPNKSLSRSLSLARSLSLSRMIQCEHRPRPCISPVPVELPHDAAPDLFDYHLSSHLPQSKHHVQAPAIRCGGGTGRSRASEQERERAGGGERARESDREFILKERTSRTGGPPEGVVRCLVMQFEQSFLHLLQEQTPAHPFSKQQRPSRVLIFWKRPQPTGQ